MHIDINDTTTFRDIQDVFAAHYPWLLLAFFRQEHPPMSGSPEREALAPGDRVRAYKATHVSGLLNISPLELVAQLEKELQQRFGLPAQVLYKEKNAWVQTTGTDSFTLKELNELSRNAVDAYVLKDYENSRDDDDIKPTKLL